MFPSKSVTFSQEERRQFMNINPHYLAPCGLYCGVCAVLMATKDNNDKLKQLLAGLYRGNLPNSETLSAHDINCEGCLSEKRFLHCRQCPIRECTQGKNISGCHKCNDFPCRLINEFPMPVGKKVILRAIPHWKKFGVEQCVRDEEARYSCPQCSKKLFRGAKRCNQCGTTVDLD
jgi:hypothetical protein